MKTLIYLFGIAIIYMAGVYSKLADYEKLETIEKRHIQELEIYTAQDILFVNLENGRIYSEGGLNFVVPLDSLHEVISSLTADQSGITDKELHNIMKYHTSVLTRDSIVTLYYENPHTEKADNIFMNFRSRSNDFIVHQYQNN